MSWLAILALAALALWGLSRFGNARYSFIYGVVVWGVAFVASLFIGDWAVAIGMLALAARWLHLKFKADEERALFGATFSDLALMKRTFEHDNPGVEYQAPAGRDAVIARVREFNARKRL